MKIFDVLNENKVEPKLSLEGYVEFANKANKHIGKGYDQVEILQSTENPNLILIVSEPHWTKLSLEPAHEMVEYGKKLGLTVKIGDKPHRMRGWRYVDDDYISYYFS